jgi:hypothetical protein
MADIVDFVGRIQQARGFGLKTTIVVTCRAATAEHFRYSEFDILEIQPMSDDAIRTAVGQWLGDAGEDFLAINSALLESGMLRSPLTLSVALSLHERRAGQLPSRLVDLYAELVETSARDWRERGLESEYGDAVIDHAVDILGFIALELLRASAVQDRDWVVGTVTRYFIQHLRATPERSARHAADFLRFAENASMYLRVSGDRLYWSHQSFQDYFAARCLTTSEHEAGNALKAIRARWFDVSRGHAPAFSTALLPDQGQRETIVSEILGSGRPERFDFVAKLLVDGCELSEDLVARLIEGLVGAAGAERDDYGTELRPSPRASFAIDLLVSLGHLDLAAQALSMIASEAGWPSRMKERARTA